LVATAPRGGWFERLVLQQETVMSVITRIVAGVIFFAVAGVGVVLAEAKAPADHGREVNVDDRRVAVQGYSPVSYFDTGRPERGNAKFSTTYGGATYYFTSAAQVEKFKADPGKYVPAFNGWCAYGMAIEKTFPIDPAAFKIVDGRLFLFLKNDKVDALELWNKGDDTAQMSKADRLFQTLTGK
jgi:YHS domain-containing protein